MAASDPGAVGSAGSAGPAGPAGVAGPAAGPAGAPGSAGQMLQLIRDGRARTRKELAELTGLARSTVAQRVEALVAARLIREDGVEASTGGRPPAVLTFDHTAKVVLVADLGATHGRLAVLDLAGTPLVERTEEVAIAAGPEVVLPWLREEFARLLTAAGRDQADLCGIGIGVPGPVEFATGRVVQPPIMPGWHEYPIPDALRERFDVPILVDNDVNIMAFGEYWLNWRQAGTLLLVKVATGIGCGIVSAGEVYRGVQGAAGDIGHIRVVASEDAPCACGNVGCVEAVASGGALARRLSQMGVAAEHSRDVVRLVRSGNREAVALVREAGRLLGQVLAGAVSLLNPAVILIGGDMAETYEQFLAGVREVVYQRSLPLATRNLQIVHSNLGDRAGVVGAAMMVVQQVFSPTAVDATLTPSKTPQLTA